ncbi:MAG: hypothetical protein ACREC9_02225 [Methylocella sp.]
MLSANKKYFLSDRICSAVILILFAVIVHAFQYRGVLGKPDLYRVIAGMMDGAETGSGLGSDLHYGREIGFGYILGLYALIPGEVLRNPDKLIPLINNLGFYSIILGLFFFWLSVCLVHGSRAAMVALALFAFSPMMLEQATSGHQILIAFFFLSAAAVCLFWPFAGWRAVLAPTAGTLLLICGLSVRAEIFLALPYLVLTRLNLTSWRTFLRSVMANAVAPTAAFIIFLILKFSIATFPQKIDFPGFFEYFYHWSNVVPGFAYMSLGCGIATVLVGAGVVVLVILRSVRPSVADDIKGTLEQLIGPIALILVPFVFWIANPAPSRHFVLVLAGISILIGWAVSNLPAFRFEPLLVGVLGLIVANQVLSEAVRPTLLLMHAARSPYRRPPEPHDTFTMAPVGWSWQHHAALEARLLQWKALGDMVATSCDTYTAIFSDQSEQIFSRLYAREASVRASVILIDGFLGLSGAHGARQYVFISKMTGWPKDAVAAVLADPSFDNYRLYADPYLPSIYDRTDIPPSRLARFGC